MAKAQYFVVQETDKTRFEVAVESNLRNGWKLVGGLFMQRMQPDPDLPERLYYCQAMTHGGKHA